MGVFVIFQACVPGSVHHATTTHARATSKQDAVYWQLNLQQVTHLRTLKTASTSWLLKAQPLKSKRRRRTSSPSTSVRRFARATRVVIALVPAQLSSTLRR